MMHGGNVWQGNGPETWLDFSANLRPEGPPEWVTKTVAQALSHMRYYPDLSMGEARRGLAAYAGVEESRILPTAGGIAAIDLALRLKQGPVRIAPVTFGEYARRAKLLNREIRMDDHLGEAGETAIVCNPNNPTGGALSREETLALHRLFSSQDGELIVDEAFIDYCPQISVRRDVCDTLTVVGSLTKILCIPGVRLGYVCASPENIEKLKELALPWQLGFAASAVASALPEHLDEIRRDAETNAERRQRMAQGLRSLGIEAQPSKANFLLCRFDRPMRPAVEKLKERHILVRTCASFGLSDCWLRLAVRTEEENQRLIEELKQCLKL